MSINGNIYANGPIHSSRPNEDRERIRKNWEQAFPTDRPTEIKPENERGFVMRINGKRV